MWERVKQGLVSLTGKNGVFQSIINKRNSYNDLKKKLSLPHNQILALTKLKAHADDKFYVAKIMISVFDRAENIAGK